MARARNIKPGLFKNEVLGVADPLYTLLFEGLWLLADREGRLEDRPIRIKGELFPYRDGLDMNAMLSWLGREGFIHRYHANGLAVIQIVAFAKHQNPHKNEAPSELPPDTESLGTASEKIGTAPADPGFLIPDSLIADTPTPAAPPPPPSAAKPKKQKPAQSLIPDDFAISERVRKWAERKGYGQLDDHLESFIRKCKAKAYQNASWDDAFMEAIREDWAKLRGKSANGAAPAPEPRRHDSAAETQRMLDQQMRGTTGMPAAVRQFAQQIKVKQ